MNQPVYIRIREILERTPGLTQKGLAERMGLNPAAVNRMLSGQRHILLDELPIIEDYIGVRLELSAPVVSNNIEYPQSAPAAVLRRGFSDTPAQIMPSAESISATHMIPVYGAQPGGMQKGLNLSRRDVVDWAARHPAQFGIADAFAVYVFSGSMEPRYFRGELVYVHPGRPPEINRDCLIEMKNGEAHIRRFLGQHEEKIKVALLNPPEEKELSKESIKAVYAVVGRG